MTIVFIDDKNQPKPLPELLPDAIAGEKTTAQIRFMSSYGSPAELTFMLQDPDPRLKLVTYTKRVEPQGIGVIELEAEPGEDSKTAIPLKIAWKARLVGR